MTDSFAPHSPAEPDGLTGRLQAALGTRYVVERELGRGGMAVVFLARDEQLGRQVAVKVLLPDLASGVSAERFQREVRVAGNLSHPNIVPVYDAGTAEGLLYYVMAYVAGESLRDRLDREGQLGLQDAVWLAGQMAAALGHAHSLGLVHRDVKPENVLVAGEHALVADFGIARAIGEDASGRLTSTGMAIGTPAYMSPEQWSGTARVDGRADQYSLACLVYEMLVGEPPFTGPTPQVILARQSMEHAPSIRVARPTVPPALEAAIERAMAKVPADRFPTVVLFADAMTAALGAPGAMAAALPPAGRRGVPSAPARQLPRRVAIALVAVLVVAAALWRLLPRGSAAGDLVARRVVVGSLENRTGEPSLGDVGSLASDWITVGLQQTGLVDVVPSPTAIQAARYVADETRAGRIRDPIRALAAETRAGIVVTGAVYRVGDSLQFHAQVLHGRDGSAAGTIDPVAAPTAAAAGAIDRLRQRVMGLLAVSLDERVAAPSGAVPPSFEAYRAFADGLERYVRNEYRDALESFGRAVTVDRTFAAAMLYAAICHSNLGQFAAADSVARAAAAASDRLTTHDLAWLDYLRAQLRGDRQSALEAIRRAAVLAPGSKAAYNTAYVALQLNRPGEALAALETLDPERGPMRGWFQYWMLLGDASHRLGRYEREWRAAQRARQLHPGRMAALRLEASALIALGRLDDLDALLVEAKSHPAGDVGPDWLMAEAAGELRAHGHPDAARRVWQDVLAWYQSQPPERARSREHRAGVASALESLGRGAEAHAIVEGLARESADPSAYVGWLGEIAARRADRAAALRHAGVLAQVRRPYRFGRDQLNRARIAALLGERERAVSLLRDAFAEGQPIPAHPDWNMDSLRTFEPFLNLMRPRG